MSIDSIGNAPLGGLYAANTPYNSTLSGAAADSGAETTGSGAQSAANGLVQALSLALQQSGFETPPVVTPPAAASSAAEAANAPPPPPPPIANSGQSSGNPVHAFIYALAQALSADAGATPVSSASGTYSSSSAGYASLENRLQSLISTLDSNNETNSTPTLKQLESAFQNLATQSAPPTTGTGAANGSSLEQFLQTLTQNLAASDLTSGQPLSGKGTLVGTTA
ncbi:MAG: hypothetical protein P8Z69_08155 [Acidihalobacter sp.]